MNARAFILVFVSGVFAVSLCGKSAPCELLTQDQVSSAVGASVGASVPIADTGCNWRTTGRPSVMVTVSMQNEKMFAGAKASSAPGMTKAPIAGVGDEAIFTGTASFASLWVRKGTTFLLVRIYGLPVGEAQAKLKTLAASAVAKL